MTKKETTALLKTLKAIHADAETNYNKASGYRHIENRQATIDKLQGMANTLHHLYMNLGDALPYDQGSKIIETKRWIDEYIDRLTA